MWERACSRRGQPIQHKTHSQTAKQALFKRHFQILSQATHPCAAAYDYARIRRLVRLEAGLYRFRVADQSAIGFSSSVNIKARSATSRSVGYFCLRWSALWWLCVGHFGAPGFLIPGLLTRVQSPPFLV
ncbi:hypothetical protein AB7M29_002140 [Pseudomonas sp. F-14 TE3623]